jgi:NAD-dependent dihydropyrimidine dehydrogenase PreA subunit
MSTGRPLDKVACVDLWWRWGDGLISLHCWPLARKANPARLCLLLFGRSALPNQLGRTWAMAYVITEACVDVMDKSCIEECPVDCIYEGGRMLYIQPDECVDCGACEPVCPVEAIFYEDDVPEDLQPYRIANADFFSEVGSPGGASNATLKDRDASLVAALAPRAEAQPS